MISLITTDSVSAEKSLAVVYNELKELSALVENPLEAAYIKACLEQKKDIIVINQYTRWLFFVQKPKDCEVPQKAEKLRNLGHKIFKLCEEYGITELQIENNTPTTLNILDFIEGIVLSAYRFDKYFSQPKPTHLNKIMVFDFSLRKNQLKTLAHLCEAVYMARNWVNEPLSHLTAEVFSQEIEQAGKNFGFKTEVFNKQKIESLKFGGLLAVNQGAKNPPTFTVLEHKPKQAINAKPYVLVGKGVVYDTGGYSLKPADSMDWMKCDMAGAAAVAGVFCALAANKIPVHVIGLIPATENRLDGNAFVPGDVITTYNGTTVEVLNTDAEGRLILADALAYAEKYEPELIIDLATLTGAALRAIGHEGSVYMGTASIYYKKQLEESGFLTHERLIEFPLWDEYQTQLESKVADLKNIGGDTAGAITAGMFLKHFVKSPWLHIDIAGTAYLKAESGYRGIHATGVGVRLLYKFLGRLLEHSTVNVE